MASQAAVQASSAAQESQASTSAEIPSFTEPQSTESKSERKTEKSPTPVEKEPILRRNEPRRQALEEIENRDLKQRGIEPEAEKEAEKESEKKSEKPADKPEIKAEPAAEAEKPAEQQVADDQPKMVKVKVDGAEFDVPEAEIEAAGGVKAYQKDKAAENRLEKANKALAETRQLQALIAQQVQRNAAQQQPQQPKPTMDQFIASRMEKLRFGTEEESASAMREILQLQRVDTNEITQNAVMTMQKNMAVDNFKKEFQDVVSNPLLLRLAATLENEHVARHGPQKDWNTFYRSIGNQVRSVTGRQSQPTANTPKSTISTTSDPISQSPSEKEARKASIVNIPTAAARATVAESKPETREDILNSMRKSRGLPVG